MPKDIGIVRSKIDPDPPKVEKDLNQYKVKLNFENTTNRHIDMGIIKILLILFISLIIILTATFFFAKGLILRKIESTVISRIEKKINKKIDIGGISYFPYRGITLKNIKIQDEAGALAYSADSVQTKLSISEFIKSKKIKVRFKINGIKKGSLKSDLNFIIESKPSKSLLKPFKSFSLDNINIINFNFSSQFSDIKDLSGIIYFKENEIAAENITFDFKNEKSKLSLLIKNANKNMSINVSVSGPHLNAEVLLGKLEENLTKIDKIEISFLGSHVLVGGEIHHSKNPVLIIDGTVNLNTKDLCHLNQKSADLCNYLRVDGNLNNDVYFRGPVNKMLDWTFKIEGSSPILKVWDYQFNELSYAINMENGVITVPLLNTYPYGGALSSSFRMDLSTNDTPYALDLKLKGINVYDMAQDSELRNKNIYGKLDTELSIKASGADQESITGGGNIHISEANLGPMPLLSPLIGQLYGVIRNLFPGLRSVEITGGSCDFLIRGRRIVTENLILWGDTLNITSRGYIDFDTNLNFEVENEFKEASESEKEDWSKTVVEIIAGFGKFIGKAYLTGTLSKPKWKFDYFSKFNDVLGGSLNNIMKNIFE